MCGQASPALGVAPILTVGWSSVGPHHAPSRAGPAGFLVWFGGSFQHAVALTRQHVVDASRGDLAVRRSNSRGQVGRLYVCAAGMNSAHAAHKKTECRRLTSAAWRRTAEVSSLPCGTLDGSSSCSRCSPTRVTRRRAGCFYACGGRNTSRLQRPSRLLAAAEPSRLPLGHRPCLSGRRQPSSLGASETGNGSSGSTSPRWRRCARGCRRGCAAPGLTSSSVGLPRRQRPRRDRWWPSLHFFQTAQIPAKKLRSFDSYTPKIALYGIFRAAFNSWPM